MTINRLAIVEAMVSHGFSLDEVFEEITLDEEASSHIASIMGHKGSAPKKIVNPVWERPNVKVSSSPADESPQSHFIDNFSQKAIEYIFKEYQDRMLDEANQVPSTYEGGVNKAKEKLQAMLNNSGVSYSDLISHPVMKFAITNLVKGAHIEELSRLMSIPMGRLNDYYSNGRSKNFYAVKPESIIRSTTKAKLIWFAVIPYVLDDLGSK